LSSRPYHSLIFVNVTAHSRHLILRSRIHDDISTHTRFLGINCNISAVSTEGVTLRTTCTDRIVGSVEIGIEPQIIRPVFVVITRTRESCDLSEIQESVHIFLVEARASFTVHPIAFVAIPLRIANAPTISALPIHARAAVSICTDSCIAGVTIGARPANLAGVAIGSHPANHAGVTIRARPLATANAPSVSAVSIIACIRIALVTILAHPAIFAVGARRALKVLEANTPSVSAVSIHARTRIALFTIVARPARFTLGASGVRPVKVAFASILSADSIHARRIALVAIVARPAIFTLGASGVRPVKIALASIITAVSISAQSRIALVTIYTRPAIYTLGACGPSPVKIAFASILCADSINARTRIALFTTVTRPAIIATAPISTAISIDTCVWAGVHVRVTAQSRHLALHCLDESLTLRNCPGIWLHQTSVVTL
jgi:hypothetical protein